MKKFNFEQEFMKRGGAKMLSILGLEIDIRTGKLIIASPHIIVGAIIYSSGDYVKQSESDYADQLDNFATELETPECQSQYGYLDAFKIEARKDADYNRYTYTKRTFVDPYVHAWTGKKNEVRHGKGITVTAFRAGEDVSTPPTEVLPGNEPRFRTKAQWLKDQTTKTTDAAEIALGIFTPHSSTDTSGIKPELSYELVSGGHPKIKYTKHDFQGIILEVDRGDGSGFVHLAEPGNPTYTDNGTLPALGIAKVWKYRAIYKMDDEVIGDYCDPISVTVKGV